MLFSRPMWTEVAAAIRSELSHPSRDEARPLDTARRARRFADILKADNPAFSYEWFFGACGLDNWGYVIVDLQPTAGGERDG